MNNNIEEFMDRELVEEPKILDDLVGTKILIDLPETKPVFDDETLDMIRSGEKTFDDIVGTKILIDILETKTILDDLVGTKVLIDIPETKPILGEGITRRRIR